MKRRLESIVMRRRKGEIKGGRRNEKQKRSIR